MTKQTKRAVTAGALFLGAALALSACGGNSGGGESSNQPNEMYTWYSSEADKAQWDAYVAAAKEANPDFKLDLSGVAITDFYTKAPTRLQQNDAPCLVTTQAERAQGLSSVLAPIDDEVKAAGINAGDYNAGMIEGMTIDGKLRGIPLDAAPSVVYYNKALFKKAGIEEPGLDWTRDDFLAAAKKLAELDGVQAVGLDSVFNTTLFYAFGNGSVPVQDGKLNLTDPNFVKDVQWVFDLAAANKVGNAPDSTVMLNTSQQNFVAGTLGMYADGPWMYGGHSEALGEDLGVAVPPSDSGNPTGVVRGTAVGITNTCPDKEAAAKTLKDFASPAVIGTIAEQRGQVPALASELKRWSSTKSAQANDVVLKLLENSKPLQTTKSWDQAVSLFQQYSPEGFNGSKTAEEILGQIQQQAGE